MPAPTPIPHISVVSPGGLDLATSIRWALEKFKKMPVKDPSLLTTIGSLGIQPSWRNGERQYWSGSKGLSGGLGSVGRYRQQRPHSCTDREVYLLPIQLLRLVRHHIPARHKLSDLKYECTECKALHFLEEKLASSPTKIQEMLSGWQGRVVDRRGIGRWMFGD
jgi:hypothetical protein